MFCCHRLLFLVIMQVQVLLMNLGNGQTQIRKDPNSPFQEIGLPFQLVEAKPNNSDHCGYSGFDLSCNCASNNVKMVEFPAIPAFAGVRLSVIHIDYKTHHLVTHDPERCLPRLFLQLYNSSISPFRFDPVFPEYSKTPTNITFFDCSSVGSRYLKNLYVSLPPLAQDMSVCPIYAAGSDESVLSLDLVSCTKLFHLVSPVPATDLQTNILRLRWCDDEIFYCSRKPIVNETVKRVLGLTVLLVFIVACFQIYCHSRKEEEDQARLESFLKDYRALKPTRFSYADIKRITNHFKDKIGEGAHGVVFRGELSIEISVAVKVLTNSEGDNKEFINEVETLGKIHHINVVRLLGLCADGLHRALVYDFFSNGSLQRFISFPDNKDSFLGWPKLQQIALDIAKGIKYLHQDCDYRILHFDINPHNVLLDHNFTPKISDFSLVKLCSKNQSIVSITKAKGTLGYIAPEIFFKNFGSISYKSDIYSYGMLLLEMVGGRKNISTSEENFQALYPEWIHNLIEGENINIHLEDEEDVRIVKKLAIVGLWCIQWHPVNRPSMKTVIQMLEGEGVKLKVPPAPFDSTASASTSTIIPARHLNLELEVNRN